MTKISFKEKDNEIKVVVDGHADFKKFGEDIVCASISTALTMTINAIDNLGYNVKDLVYSEGYSTFTVESNDNTKAIIKTFKEVVSQLSEEHPKNVKIIKQED